MTQWKLIAIVVTRSVAETSRDPPLFGQSAHARLPVISLSRLYSFTRQLEKLGRKLWARAFVLMFEEDKRFFPILIANAL